LIKSICSGLKASHAAGDYRLGRQSPAPGRHGCLHNGHGDDPAADRRFFVAMAITIIAGLMFAALLTMIFVPVLYATFYSDKTA
jgi:hypothetical protein